MTPFSQFLQQQTPGAGAHKRPFMNAPFTANNAFPLDKLQGLFQMLGLYKAMMSHQQPGRPQLPQPQQQPQGSMPTMQRVGDEKQKWLQRSNPASATSGPRY